MKKFLLHLWKERSAQDLIEYALLLFLAGLVAGSTVKSFGNQVGNAFSISAAKIASTAGGNNGGGNGDIGF